MVLCVTASHKNARWIIRTRPTKRGSFTAFCREVQRAFYPAANPEKAKQDTLRKHSFKEFGKILLTLRADFDYTRQQTHSANGVRQNRKGLDACVEAISEERAKNFRFALTNTDQDT